MRHIYCNKIYLQPDQTQLFIQDLKDIIPLVCFSFWVFGIL